MHFERLTMEEKVEATLLYFKNKDAARSKGQKDADRYMKRNCRRRQQ